MILLLILIDALTNIVFFFIFGTNNNQRYKCYTR